jgi:hypothetical protein
MTQKKDILTQIAYPFVRPFTNLLNKSGFGVKDYLTSGALFAKTS